MVTFKPTKDRCNSCKSTPSMEFELGDERHVLGVRLCEECFKECAKAFPKVKKAKE